VIIFEVRGGSDKGPDGHRKDTMPIARWAAGWGDWDVGRSGAAPCGPRAARPGQPSTALRAAAAAAAEAAAAGASGSDGAGRSRGPSPGCPLRARSALEKAGWEAEVVFYCDADKEALTKKALEQADAFMMRVNPVRGLRGCVKGGPGDRLRGRGSCKPLRRNAARGRRVPTHRAPFEPDPNPPGRVRGLH
jgi:hypothetical protein